MRLFKVKINWSGTRLKAWTPFCLPLPVATVVSVSFTHPHPFPFEAIINSFRQLFDISTSRNQLVCACVCVCLMICINLAQTRRTLSVYRLTALWRLLFARVCRCVCVRASVCVLPWERQWQTHWPNIKRGCGYCLINFRSNGQRH